MNVQIRFAVQILGIWLASLVSFNCAVAGTTIADAKPISLSLQPGDTVTIRNQQLKVIKRAAEGRRGVVFQVQANTGAVYALKIAKNSDPDTLASLEKETEKAAHWQALKIPHSKILDQEKEFILKTWIEGLSGKEVIEKYTAGDMSYKAAITSLLNLVAKIRAQKAYVGDFRPPNLIWTGKAWIVVDSGGIQRGMTLEGAQDKWSSSDSRGQKFERRWKMSLPPVRCEDVFSKAG